MGQKITVSGIVLIGGKIDKNLLAKCLNSLKWCDEIIKIETSSLGGSFADWRNEGAKRAKGDWLLYIDADEEAPKDLRLNNENSCYAIPRRNYIFGKEFKHGGQWPDYQKRLFLKKDFQKWVGKLHEEPIFKGHLEHLENPIIHHKNISLSEMIEKTNKWSEIEAKLMFDAGHPPMNIFRFFSAGFREFWQRMILQMAFLDGTEGIVYALYQVFSRLISYSKLWEKQQL